MAKSLEETIGIKAGWKGHKKWIGSEYIVVLSQLLMGTA
jgi:hypothetical protein